MKKQWRGFISGIIVATLVLTLGIPALAATVRQLEANYKGIKITLDGKEIVPKDANGVTVEPFTVDGTTYLPLRPMAGALGLDVAWDGATQTVKMTTPGAVPAETQTPVDAKNITLSNGNYIAGTDFPVGTYNVIAISGRGNVMSDNLFDGGINAMMGITEDEFSKYYSKEYKNIRFQKGTELQVIGAMGELTIQLVQQ